AGVGEAGPGTSDGGGGGPRPPPQGGGGGGGGPLPLDGPGGHLGLLPPLVGALGARGERSPLDLPGAGGGAAPPAPQRLPQIARLLAGALDVLGRRRVDVLGISWGGAVAQQFAYQCPERCRRLVLVSTGTGAIMVPGRPSVLALLAS